MINKETYDKLCVLDRATKYFKDLCYAQVALLYDAPWRCRQLHTTCDGCSMNKNLEYRRLGRLMI